tara:strand:+ start:1202 stop:1933 length:732 start_codon:yes stop_codon:yes gene_type:complete
MPTPRSVSKIKSDLLRPATTSHFEVELSIPSGLRGKYSGDNRQGKMQLMCSEASLPGSSLATHQIDNNFHGVTERHAYRRLYEDRLDLNFYVDANQYLPIKFFEDWMSFITNEEKSDALANSYTYDVKYPDTYTAAGLKVIKFEKDYKSSMTYQFVKSFPIQITSMPVSYDGSSLLQCNVSLTYLRYVVGTNIVDVYTPFSTIDQARFNARGIVGGFVDSAVDRLTGNDLLGDIAGGIAANLL